MTKEEREFCESCTNHGSCQPGIMGLGDTCLRVVCFAQGYETAKEKAVGWLEKNLHHYFEIGNLDTTTILNDLELEMFET